MDKDNILNNSSWKEFEAHVKNHGFTGKIPRVFDIPDNIELSVSDVAELTGVSKETVSRWCRGWKLRTLTGMSPYKIKGEDLKEYIYQWQRNDLLKKVTKDN
jgi:excisionase family DNA binding protein